MPQFTERGTERQAGRKDLTNRLYSPTVVLSLFPVQANCPMIFQTQPWKLLFAVVASLLLPVLVRGQDVKPIKALLVIGGCCHDYAAQKDLLKKGIEERAHVEVTIAYDPDKTTRHLNPAYENADWAKGFDVVIHDECSGRCEGPDHR